MSKSMSDGSTIMKILNLFAKSVLSAQEGCGTWQKAGSDKWERPRNPLLGLEVGQTVYGYDDNEEEIIYEAEVCVVHDGIGYIAWFADDFRPLLEPVTEGVYAKSVPDAVNLFRELLKKDVEYCERKAEKAAKLREIIRLVEGVKVESDER